MATQPAQPAPGPPYDWARLVGHSLEQNGPWVTWEKLVEARRAYPDDMLLRGYAEIVRTTIVRDLLANPRGLQATPKLTPEFLSDFDRFNLTAQEGYLISLIDGRITIEMLLKLTPFDNFTTLFNLAKLQNQRAITVPS
ncbi:MAG TPA: hypothetical protein VMS56_03410 [Thermoanaerobaculia bacterium]|nr:hypothetical protein [Thermoanaerobaculia bacterium]